ncbi:PTS sugar transporter subunit IIA [Staphylococcus haemolyticus]|uniref:PTS sugar transporter subunit IIA n=1 Tax=Staphylococcus haemolyticus TaxID=1283 RepID=UPI00143F4291|nr:PTS sugar transporter subunit IIA [Staphylococcus haemolyticus]MCH4458109.1 PTS sugar transporter subunit IIA [Staphylococcus haemolyticus]MCH4490772.1 PTS sugar transporter subunit IIA [Staphylococcus haemolyticus]NKN66603.1 PTS sugar transporter subunit IIA [Staphylococcus haemolyticus]
MSLEILTKDRIVLEDNVETWEQAIQHASKPLIDQKIIENNYVTSMIESVQEFGPYIVIAPEIAIAHARPDNNVNEVGLSLLKLDDHINFSNDGHYASLIFVLSAVDSNSHLGILQSLAQLLGNKENVEKLLDSKSKEDIINIIKEND